MATISKLVYFTENEWDDSITMHTIYGDDPNKAPRNVKVYRIEIQVPYDATDFLHDGVQDGIAVNDAELVADAVGG